MKLELRTINITIHVRCPRCNGTGFMLVPPYPDEPCDRCARLSGIVLEYTLYRSKKL